MNDRKTDNLLNAIGALPDFLIDESAEGSEEMKNRNITKWVTIAAVFVFVALTCVIFAIHGRASVVTPSDSDKAASESEETSAPESTTEPETTEPETTEPETVEPEPPAEPEIAREVFKLEKDIISFPAAPKSEKTKNMLANGGLLDAQDEKPHCAVFSVHTVDDLDFLKEEILIPGTDAGYGKFDSKSECFDDGFFSENTLYVSFVEAPSFSRSAVNVEIVEDGGIGDALEISFGFKSVGDFAYATEPYCVFLTVPNSRAENLKAVDCTYGDGEYDHIATVIGVVTEVSQGTATLRLIDEDRDLFSDEAKTVTFGTGRLLLTRSTVVEIAYNDIAEVNTDGQMAKALFYRELELDDLNLPEAVGQSIDTEYFIDTEEGYDLMGKSRLCIRNCSPDHWEDSIFGISSAEELTECCRLLFDAMMLDPDYSISSIYSPERLAEMYAEEYGKFSEEYDEEFFRSHSLLIMYSLEGYSAQRYRPTKVKYGEDGTITVGLCHVSESIMPATEGAVCVFVPVEKDALAHCTGVSVEVIEINDGW